MKHCSNLYFLSAIACQLSECLDETTLEILASDLNTLAHMLESIQARSSCSNPAIQNHSECSDRIL